MDIIKDKDLIEIQNKYPQIEEDYKWLDEHREAHISNKDSIKDKGWWYQKTQFFGCDDKLRAYLIASSYTDGYNQALIDNGIKI